MSGNFYCVTQKCSRILYQSYKAGGIRYRYGSGAWKFIDGDDYTIDNEIGTCPVKYNCYGIYYSKNLNNCNELGYWKNQTKLIGTEVESYQPVEGAIYWEIPLKNGSVGYIRPINKYL